MPLLENLQIQVGYKIVREHLVDQSIGPVLLSFPIALITALLKLSCHPL